MKRSMKNVIRATSRQVPSKHQCVDSRLVLSELFYRIRLCDYLVGTNDMDCAERCVMNHGSG